MIDSKVAVGIYTSTELEIADLIDETVEPDLCEYKKLPSGGFIIGGAPVMHDIEGSEAKDSYVDGWSVTESWGPIYEDDDLSHRMDTAFFDNDE